MAVMIYRLTDAGFARVTDNTLDLRIIEQFAAPLPLPYAAQPKGDIATIWQTDTGFGDWEMN